MVSNFCEIHYVAAMKLVNQSPTKTAYVFSGIDGLDNMQDRLLMLSLPTVQKRIAQAQEILSQLTPHFDLAEYIASPDLFYKKDVTLQALAVAVVQIGVFDHLISKTGPPEYLIGCSLGDIARTFCAGALDFEVIVKSSWLYHLKAREIQGAAYHVKVLEGVVEPAMLKEISDAGIYLAVFQTPRNFLVSGSVENLEKWHQKELEINRYKIKPLYNKPLHSPLMSSVTESIHAHYAGKLKSSDQWKYQMVSATNLKVLTSKEELLHDMITNFNSTVYWMQAVQLAVNELAVTRFVNIGPAQTLLLFSQRTPLSYPLELVNHFGPPPEPLQSRSR